MALPRVSPPGSAQIHKTQQELQNPQTLCCRTARAARSLNQLHPARGKPEKRKLTRVLQAVELSPAAREQQRQPHSKPQLPPGSPAAHGAQEAPMAARQGAPRPGRSAEPCAAAQWLIPAGEMEQAAPQ